MDIDEETLADLQGVPVPPSFPQRTRRARLTERIGMTLGAIGPQDRFILGSVVDAILTYAIGRGWDNLADGIEEA